MAAVKSRKKRAPPVRETKKARTQAHTPRHAESGKPELVVVGLGASAGGLAALEEFFASLPPETGMAFVVITHQHAGHPSMMAEILGRKTSMPVTQVAKATGVRADHVYTARPG